LTNESQPTIIRSNNEIRTSQESACRAAVCPQHILEPILLDAARSCGADIRFDHEVVAVGQTSEHATARVRKRLDGSECEVRARYIVGCDGARTIVGEQGGFQFEGRAGLGNAITVWIEADLSRYTKHRSGALFFVRNPGNTDVLSVWTCVEPWTEWSTIFVREGLDATELSEESVMPRVRAAIGDPSVEVRIKKISEWQINHVVAAKYRRGWLFLAGDAAHRHPPANGLGSNTSIQDSYNLAWKLALVLSGTARDSLLDSYDAERQPVGRRIVDRANRSVAEMVPCLTALEFQPGSGRTGEPRDRREHRAGRRWAGSAQQRRARCLVAQARDRRRWVRTDRIVAARCPRRVSDPAGVLREAVTKILGR
jgi:2,4-dichlorophenol 6-monooxygenase